MRFTRKWQLLSVVILAVVVVGLSFPEAFGHATNSVSHGFQHILDALTAIAAQITNLDADVADLNTDLGDVQTTVDAIETDLEVKKKFYSKSDTKHVVATAPDGFAGGNFAISIDCLDVELDSCAFTVEGILVRATGLEFDGLQECVVFSINIDDAVNSDLVSITDITLFGTGTPAWDSNILVEWGIGPVAASDTVFVNYDCTTGGGGDAVDLDADFEVTVVGEMPQGADITLDVF
ncbi:MAG TPA: hypothetical protein VJZ17_02870 [Nitrosopumilaceae archaeon]|nr:hypothetical protein [Nitrosopumilaceae archaeon]